MIEMGENTPGDLSRRSSAHDNDTHSGFSMGLPGAESSNNLRYTFRVDTWLIRL